MPRNQITPWPSTINQKSAKHKDSGVRVCQLSWGIKRLKGLPWTSRQARDPLRRWWWRKWHHQSHSAERKEKNIHQHHHLDPTWIPLHLARRREKLKEIEKGGQWKYPSIPSYWVELAFWKLIWCLNSLHVQGPRWNYRDLIWRNYLSLQGRGPVRTSWLDCTDS